MMQSVYLARREVIRALRGKVTTRNRSIPMAMLVKTLAETDRCCMKSTMGHMGLENIHVRVMTKVNVKGMQIKAMIRSDTARLIRNGLMSVRHLLPLVKTMTTRMFPTMEKMMVKVYSNIKPVLASWDKIGSMSKEVMLERFPAELTFVLFQLT